MAPTYNPRALLNPKAARSQNRNPAVAVNGRTKSELANRPASSDKDNSPAASSSMLEGLYGVEKRHSRPAKRVKLAEGQEEQKQDSHATASSRRGNGSVIAKYMQESGRADKAVSHSELVDLTKDDDTNESDDDLKIVRSVNLASEQEVCFGMIYTNVHAHAVPKPANKSQFSIPSQWPVIKCTLVRVQSADTVIQVKDPTDFTFGKIAPDVAAVLAPVMDGLRKLRTQARLTNRPRKDTDTIHGPVSGQMKMMINIYGKRADVDKIGRVFGQHNIWFKNPVAAEIGFPTVNPHAARAPMVTKPATRHTASLVGDVRTLEEATNAVSKLFDHFAKDAKPLAETDTSNLILTALLPHQKQALTFMLQQERPRQYGPSEDDNSSLWRKRPGGNGAVVYEEVVTGITVKDEPEQIFGGLLADVMGLGKTLEALCLIVETKEAARNFGRQKPDQRQVEADVILAQSKATLIVAPVSTVKNWEDQIAEHVRPGAIKYYVYHGPNRIKDVSLLAQYDIVISTYSTIAIECSKKVTSVSPVQQIRWFRVVLDEAHTIREPRASQSQAMYSISAERRWCLTGTPIQNRIDDLGSLTRFLRLYPYDTSLRFNQYVRSPAVSGDPNFLKALRIFVDSFTLRRLKDRVNLPHRTDLVETLTFSEDERMLHDFFRAISRDRVQEIAISHTTNGKAPGVQHSQVLRSIMTLRLICAHGRELLKDKDLAMLKGHTSKNAIDLDNDSLPTFTTRSAYETLSLLAEADLDFCRNCDKKISDDAPHIEELEPNAARAYVLPCLDIVCADCFKVEKPGFDILDAGARLSCPYCFTPISAKYVTIDKSTAENLDSAPDDTVAASKEEYTSGKYIGPHTKTRALLRDLDEARTESRTLMAQGELPLKCIVFSEFTSHLDLLGRALADHGHGFVRIDGTMSLAHRRGVLDTLNTDTTVTVLLASIKAAGQGLNLTVASRAFIMEPLWNPAAEAQAVDRIYRIGQKREVIVKRYRMEESFELKIVELQKKKQQLADLSMNRNHSALSRKDIKAGHLKDLLDLFR